MVVYLGFQLTLRSTRMRYRVRYKAGIEVPPAYQIHIKEHPCHPPVRATGRDWLGRRRGGRLPAHGTYWVSFIDIVHTRFQQFTYYKT